MIIIINIQSYMPFITLVTTTNIVSLVVLLVRCSLMLLQYTTIFYYSITGGQIFMIFNKQVFC
jgi:hypothetical protein